MTLQEKNFRDREETLKRKDIELQESLIRFSKFLQDNDAKRVRALKKASDERKTREDKERETAEMVALISMHMLPLQLARHKLQGSVDHLTVPGNTRRG